MVPRGLQAVVEQKPPTQEKEQHSLEEVQALAVAVPPGVQKVLVVHLPEAQTVEQHWEPAVQLSPPSRQAAATVAPHLPLEQIPEQQSEAAMHAVESAAQEPDG